MPRIDNTPGPDFARIKPFGSSFAANMELEKRDLVTFERIVKLAAECSQINMTETEAIELIDSVSNKLRSAIGCEQKRVMSRYGNAAFVVKPDAIAA